VPAAEKKFEILMRLKKEGKIIFIYA